MRKSVLSRKLPNNWVEKQAPTQRSAADEGDKGEGSTSAPQAVYYNLNTGKTIHRHPCLCAPASFWRTSHFKPTHTCGEYVSSVQKYGGIGVRGAGESRTTITRSHSVIAGKLSCMQRLVCSDLCARTQTEAIFTEGLQRSYSIRRPEVDPSCGPNIDSRYFETGLGVAHLNTLCRRLGARRNRNTYNFLLSIHR